MTPQAALPPSPLPIVGHGRGWLVVEKPVTMSVHNEPGADLCTVFTAWFKSHPEAADLGLAQK